eukprot:3941737-Rhodomonas_salina.6
MSGTELAYAATKCYAMCGTELGYAPTRSATATACCSTQSGCQVTYPPTRLLRDGYATSSTDTVYAAIVSLRDIRC